MRQNLLVNITVHLGDPAPQNSCMCKTVYIYSIYFPCTVYAELVSENENQHRDKSNNLPNVLSFVTRYLVRRGDLRPCH